MKNLCERRNNSFTEQSLLKDIIDISREERISALQKRCNKLSWAGGRRKNQNGAVKSSEFTPKNYYLSITEHELPNEIPTSTKSRNCKSQQLCCAIRWAKSFRASEAAPAALLPPWEDSKTKKTKIKRVSAQAGISPRWFLLKLRSKPHRGLPNGKGNLEFHAELIPRMVWSSRNDFFSWGRIGIWMEFQFLWSHCGYLEVSLSQI